MEIRNVDSLRFFFFVVESINFMFSMKNFLQKSKGAFAVFMMSALSCPAVWAGDDSESSISFFAEDVVSEDSVKEAILPSSVTLDYQNGSADSMKYADIIMNTIKVSKSADSTYFGILDWNCYQMDGANGATKIRGGYCGFQQGKGYITRSASATFWDDELPFSFEEACDSFRYSFSPSGDMKGLSTSYHCDYAENYWYTIVSRVWNEDGNTKFGFWYLDHTNEFWLHAVNYVYPSKTMVFENKVTSFVDDFAKVNDPSKSSSAIYGPAVTRTIDGVWSSRKSANVFGTYGNTDFDAIASNGAFNMTLGGVAYNTDTLDIDASAKKFFTASNIKSYLFNPLTISKVGYADDMLTWDILINRLPQFAWEYSVKDLSNNEVILTASSVSADAREAEILFTKNGSYEITLTLTDIFDNKIDTTFIQKITDKEPVAQETSCLEMLNGFTVQPTGVNIEVPVEIHNSIVELKIVDNEGNIALGGASFGPQLMSGPQNHSLYLNTYGLPLNGEYYLVASINDKNCISNFSAARGLYDEADPVADNVEGIKFVYSTFYSTLVGFEAAEDVTATVTVSSVYGWTVKSETIRLSKGLNSYLIDVNSSLSIGQTFMVNIQFNGKNYSEKFIVK